MEDRYGWLLDHGRRKITRGDEYEPVLVVFDELAYFSATVGETKQQKEFTGLLRDLVGTWSSPTAASLVSARSR
jgi:S-DNA-T family DNA segregation ATPase FtsK/SpoIIIE